jgi:hypothetical protein
MACAVRGARSRGPHTAEAGAPACHPSPHSSWQTVLYRGPNLDSKYWSQCWKTKSLGLLAAPGKGGFALAYYPPGEEFPVLKGLQFAPRGCAPGPVRKPRLGARNRSWSHRRSYPPPLYAHSVNGAGIVPSCPCIASARRPLDPELGNESSGPGTYRRTRTGLLVTDLLRGSCHVPSLGRLTSLPPNPWRERPSGLLLVGPLGIRILGEIHIQIAGIVGDFLTYPGG